ncbi:hypothetical protein LY76DRAFT_609921 [Colletotrichum caudatum]|nr:hypothetical protein LY76DRAFT_609921 [Colletotrichum caudatum]
MAMRVRRSMPELTSSSSDMAATLANAAVALKRPRTSVLSAERSFPTAAFRPPCGGWAGGMEQAVVLTVLFTVMLVLLVELVSWVFLVSATLPSVQEGQAAIGMSGGGVIVVVLGQIVGRCRLSPQSHHPLRVVFPGREEGSSPGTSLIYKQAANVVRQTYQVPVRLARFLSD